MKRTASENRYIENYECLSISQFIRQSKRTGKPLDEIVRQFTGGRIELTYKMLNFGKRYYFACPKCKTNIINLYITAAGLYCRDCLGLKYRDQGQHRDRFYESTIKPLKQAAKIENRLNRKLRHKTRNKLMQRFEEIVKQYNSLN